MLVDEDKVRHNIRKMAAKAQDCGVWLRPHFKTHQSAEIAEWFRQEGIDRATVSSVEMARYFAEAGWKDLTIAFPYNPLEYHQIDELARKITLNVTIVSAEALDHLCKEVNAPVGYFIKVDVGTHRTGINPSDEQLIKRLAQVGGASQHTLKGLLAHAGHAYQVLTVDKAVTIFQSSVQLLHQVKKVLGLPELLISYGDTPTCSLMEHFSGVDELRPGNFAFYDTMQHSFGVCDLDQISVCMVCPVVAVHPERGETVIYGGAVHFSKDFLEMPYGRNYGTVVRFRDQGWDTTPIGHLSRLSQEHGVVILQDSVQHDLKIGDLIGILPVHSCLTADLCGFYMSLKGKQINKFNKTGL